jgi:hypothetical protein
MRTQLSALLATALACTFSAAPANAQAIRTFVSAAGSDSNPCSITQPCRHFSAAVAATTAGGEVDALDPGAYGSFTIGQAITIEGQGWSYVAPPSGGAAIAITAVSGNVNIRGVSLNGVGVTSASGIALNGGGNLNIQNSVIRNFTQDGIAFKPNSSNPSQLFVSNALVSDNTNNGIVIFPTGSGATSGVLDRVAMEKNGAGLAVQSGTQTVDVTVSDSVSASNTNVGIVATSSGVMPASIMVRDSTIANNSGLGLESIGSVAAIRVTRSTITGNGSGWTVINSGTVSTYNDNNIDGNASVNTAPPCVNGTSPCTAYK